MLQLFERNKLPAFDLRAAFCNRLKVARFGLFLELQHHRAGGATAIIGSVSQRQRVVVHFGAILGRLSFDTLA
jgi:hypothetical protein